MTVFWRRAPDFWTYWLPPLAWSAGILILSGDWGAASHTLVLIKWLLGWIPGLTPAQIQLIHGYLRKVGHAVAYGMLFFFWFRALHGYQRFSRSRALLGALGLCLLWALLDEGHQTFINSRGGSLRDVALDLGGAALGALITLSVWTPRGSRLAAATSQRKTGGLE